METSKLSGDDQLRHEITERVKEYDIQHEVPYPEDNTGSKRAAVLLPIKIENGEVYVLLTKRSAHLRAHPGSVSFPGGKRDESDGSDIETALREAEEEIGLPRHGVTILGILTRGITLPNTVVYPVVGIIPGDFIPIPNPGEVDFAFYMPLRDFISPDKVTYEMVTIRGKPILFMSVLYECEGKVATVWGFTATYCTLLAKIVFKQTDKVVHIFDEAKDDSTDKHVEGMKQYFELVRNSLSSTTKSKL